MNLSLINPVRVVIADKNEAYSEALKSFLKCKSNVILTEVCNSVYFLESILDSSDVDILLIDEVIFEENFIEGIKKINSKYPNIRIIVLSLNESSNIKGEILKTGVCHYISKWDSTIDLIKAINYN